MSNLLTRALTGAVYIGVVLVGVLSPSPVIWLALALVLGVPALYEFQQVFVRRCAPEGETVPVPTGTIAPLCWGDVIAGAVTITALIGIVYAQVLTAVLPLIAVAAVYFVLRPFLAVNDHGPSPLVAYARYLTSLMYICLPMGALMDLCAVRASTGIHIALFMFIMIWCNDTGAYLVGSTMGRNKMCPRLSPKKSWEGFFGGFLFALAAGLAWWYVDPQLPIWLTLLIGAAVSISATYGDLFESLMKRRAGVKDAGALLPGHGGMLDRIDSLLFCAPVTYMIWMAYLFL